MNDRDAAGASVETKKRELEKSKKLAHMTWSKIRLY